MTQNNPTNVFVAFEMLLEEMEVEIDLSNRAGANSFQISDYDGVEQHRERARQATTLRNKLVDLRKEWEVLVAVQQNKEEEEHIHSERRNSGRLQRGVRTPEATFRQPILKALNEMGGSARMNDVLTRVEQLMKGILKPVDFDPLTSDPDIPRWRNTAQWERNSMAREGLLKSNSRRGVWEITEEGRKAFSR